MEEVDKLPERLIRGDLLSREEALRLCREEVDLLDLMRAANRLRERFFGRKVSFCSIINAKSGRCAGDCIFCAQSSRHGAEIKIYPMMEEAELLGAIRRAAGRGVEHVGVVTSGVRAPKGKELDAILRCVGEGAKKDGPKVCCSLGQIDERQARLLKEAGVTRYHHNLESSADFYKKVSRAIDYRDKVATVRAAKNAGLETCCGGIFGLGEKWEDRVELAATVRELSVDSVPLNFLHPVKGTPVESYPPLPPREALRIIALFRLMLPDRTIKVCGGREFVLRDMQSLMFHAGANGAILGNYLTTAGRPPEEDLQMLEDLGLEAAGATSPGGSLSADAPPSDDCAGRPVVGLTPPSAGQSAGVALSADCGGTPRRAETPELPRRDGSGSHSRETNWTAIVTGASRGLGKAIALAFAAEGARVALICKTHHAKAVEVARQIEKEGGVAWAYRCDVSDSKSVRETIENIFRRAGSIDVLVNNAGAAHSSLFLKTDERTWDEVVSTNLTGVFNCTRAVIPFMIRQGKGHIVNIGSLSGIRGAAGAAAYCASKAGLIGLTLSTAREYGKRNIAANAVLPGYMPTEMGNSMSPASKERIFSENVLGRGSTIEEVAAFVVRLTKMEGVSGQVFNLDSRWVRPTAETAAPS